MDDTADDGPNDTANNSADDGTNDGADLQSVPPQKPGETSTNFAKV
ncbi:hypothetical protein [Chryseobacterium koreense]|nr:hypothetical protein [Chryseobacterium koreense]MBB5334708.1 hypothetical protein [Chryseobacterium koreense]